MLITQNVLKIIEFKERSNKDFFWLTFNTFLYMLNNQNNIVFLRLLPYKITKNQLISFFLSTV